MMHHILSRKHRPLLASFAVSNVVLGFDYDGTLAPIVADHQRAAMRPATRRLLAAVAVRYPSVVISGRARGDLVRRVGNIPIWHLAGNHGLEPWSVDAAYADQVARWVQVLQAGTAGFPGVHIEDKVYSVTVHYRHSRRRAAALAAIMRICRRLRDARILNGHCAVSLVPVGAPHKGAALERARRLLACDTAIYLGDDGTDEDAFCADAPERLLAVRIGRDRHSAAKFFLRNQEEVDALLQLLRNFRPLRTAHRRHGR